MMNPQHNKRRKNYCQWKKATQRGGRSRQREAKKKEENQRKGEREGKGEGQSSQWWTHVRPAGGHCWSPVVGARSSFRFFSYPSTFCLVSRWKGKKKKMKRNQTNAALFQTVSLQQHANMNSWPAESLSWFLWFPRQDIKTWIQQYYTGL